MKTQLVLIALAAGALFAATPEASALPPRQHAVAGVIKAVDYDARTITLIPTESERPLVFVWKDSTRFSQGWSRICPGAVEPGQKVKVHYRRELSQWVPREVSLHSETPARCTPGGCCAKRN